MDTSKLDGFSYTHETRFYILAHGNSSRDPDCVYEISSLRKDWRAGRLWTFKEIAKRLFKYIPAMGNTIPKVKPVISLIICSSARKSKANEDSAYFDSWAGKLHTFLGENNRFVDVKARTTVVNFKKNNLGKEKVTVPIDKQDIYAEKLKNKDLGVALIEKISKQAGSKITFSFEKVRSGFKTKTNQVIRDSYTNTGLAHQAMKFFKALYKIERRIKNDSIEQLHLSTTLAGLSCDKTKWFDIIIGSVIEPEDCICLSFITHLNKSLKKQSNCRGEHYSSKRLEKIHYNALIVRIP